MDQYNYASKPTKLTLLFTDILRVVVYLYQAIWRMNKPVYLILSRRRTRVRALLFKKNILPAHYSKVAANELKWQFLFSLVMFTE